MDNQTKTNPLIAKILGEKGVLHLDIMERTMETFEQIKKILAQTKSELNNTVTKNDKRLVIELTDKGIYEFEFKIASDTLIFILHSNVFIFDQEHHLWKTSYIHDHPNNAHCGIISIYNFLSDSFTFNRTNDIGYMIARIFINHESHIYVEGKRQLGFLYNDFEHSLVTHDILKAILDSTLLYSLDFDMYIPPFDSVNQITVQEIITTSISSSSITGKRLGFRFQSDHDRID